MKLRDVLGKTDRVYIVPTRYGFIYGALVLILLSLATIFNSSNCLFVAALFVTFGVVCMHQTHANISSLSVMEVDSQSGFAGDKFYWKLKILNDSQSPSFAVNILDDVIDIPARETSIENIAIEHNLRGEYQIRQIRISSTYPLGFFFAWKWAPHNARYYVYPSLAATEMSVPHQVDRNLDLDSREDFLGHRDFVLGDSAHHVDWKIQARRQKMLVKLFDSNHIESVFFDWEKIPGRDTEKKLSQITKSIYNCYRQQKPFGLRLPHKNIPVGLGLNHYEICLQALATFGENHAKAS